jgi:catechol 2,3-dioxygenase-like lactoylglutathione lyase family enzyme
MMTATLGYWFPNAFCGPRKERKMGIPANAKPMAFIVTRDRDRSKAFYGATRGFALTHEDDFAVVFDINGIALRISTVPDHVAPPHTVLGWQVDDIETAVRALHGEGVAFTTYEGFGQDTLGIWTAPSGRSKVAWFADPDGNLLSLAQL